MFPFLRVFDLISGWIWALMFTGAVAAGGITSLKLSKLEARVAEERVLALEKQRAQEAVVRQRERQHAEELLATNQENEREKAALSARVDRLLVSLQNRPARPSGDAVPPSGPLVVGCTGAGLYRSDSEFLVREAARADRLRAELSRCQAAYDSAVKLTAGE